MLHTFYFSTLKEKTASVSGNMAASIFHGFINKDHNMHHPCYQNIRMNDISI
jgi:hypothetical protein